MKVSARLLLGVILGLIVSITIHPVAFAQTAAFQTNPYTNFNTNSDVPHNFHSFTQVVTTEVLSAMVCQLSGIDPTRSDRKCLGIDPQTGRFGFVNNGGGAIGLTARGIAFTYQLPIHTAQYVAYLSNNFGLYDKTYAAPSTGQAGAQKNGVGFTGLAPLLNIWATFRNLVYLLFVIIFVVIGVAIMLRVQIDPRTVMTVENTLPKIVIGLILITFSFAIAGVMVDLMWVLTFFVVNTMHNVDPGAQEIAQKGTVNLLEHPIIYLDGIWNQGIWGLVGGVRTGLGDFINGVFTTYWSAGHNVNDIAPGTQSTCTPVSLPLNIDFGCLIMTLVTTILNVTLQVLGVLLGWIIIMIALLIALIRLWVSLLKAYVLIILDVILGPFYIAAGIIPGSTFGFGGWIKSLIANLLTFPTVVFMLLLARVLNDNFSTSQGLFIPPLIGNPNDTGNPIGAFIAFGIILITPEIINVLRKAFQVPDTGLGAVAVGGMAAGARFFGSTARNIGGSIIDYKFGRQASVNPGFGAVLRGFFGR